MVDFNLGTPLPNARVAGAFLSQHWVFNVGAPPPTAGISRARRRSPRPQLFAQKATASNAAARQVCVVQASMEVDRELPPEQPGPSAPTSVTSVELPEELVQSTIELALMQPLSQTELAVRDGRWLASLRAGSLVCRTWRAAVQRLCESLDLVAERCTLGCLEPWTARGWHPAHYWLWMLEIHRRRLRGLLHGGRALHGTAIPETSTWDAEGRKRPECRLDKV